MLITALIVILVLDVAWIAYAMVNAPVIDDDDNFIISNEKESN